MTTDEPIAPPLRYDPLAQRDLILRPHPVLRVVSVVGPAALTAWLLKVSWDEAAIDPRVLLLPAQFLLLVVIVLRAQVVVAGGALWRRSFRRYAGIDLGALDAVELRRARYLKQEGLVRTMLHVQDRSGRTLALKPALWSGGARPLLAGLGSLARQQGVVLDQRTSEAVDRAQADLQSTPAWVANVGLRPDGPATEPLPASSFWLRRDEHGRPKKGQPQWLVILPIILGLVFGGALYGSRVATDRLRSARCDRSRHLWEGTQSGSPSPVSLDAMADRLVGASASLGQPQRYRLDPSDLANEHNTEAVQRDALRLREGLVIEWVVGQTVEAHVYLERFDSAASAVQFHRDYAEDHCRADRAFAAPAVPGSVGFRCSCEGDVVNDRVSFVRGDLRVQAIVWTVPRGSDHERAEALAAQAMRVLG